MRRRYPLISVIVAVLAAACTSAEPSTRTSAPADTSATSEPSAPSGEPTPSVAATTASDHPGEGVSDPAGRIAFGRITGEDPLYGQVVAISAIDPDGSDLVQVTDGDSGFPAWAPDGTRIAFTQRQPDGTWQIATAAPDGTDPRVLTTGFGADNASWAPDGTRIVYQRFEAATDDPDFHTTIWRMNADGSGAEQIGDPDEFDLEPKISPDGMSVLFHRLSFPDDQQRQTLVVRDLATGSERVIEAAGTAAEHAAWSPDGAWIVYDDNPNYGAPLPNDQVMRIAADGSGEPEVLFPATAESGGFKPSYSPDGTRIVFGCFFETTQKDVACLMNADGSDVTVLIDDPNLHENHFSWGPPVH